jgi:hypothetical protein
MRATSGRILKKKLFRSAGITSPQEHCLIAYSFLTGRMHFERSKPIGIVITGTLSEYGMLDTSKLRKKIVPIARFDFGLLKFV